jgi:phosphatidylinositol-3-phosphatase
MLDDRGSGRRPGPRLTTAIAGIALLALTLVPSGAAQSELGGPVPVAGSVLPPSPTPYIQHVVVVVLENEGATTTWGHGKYERYLAGQYGNASSYYAACHPSAPNYLAMFAAVVNQCGSDSWNNYTNTTLANEFDHAGLSWGSYAEDLPSNACSSPGSATAGLFATRHVPALFFAGVLRDSTYCHNHVLGSDSFNNSMANGTLRNYSFYTPNLCDDGHNGCGGNTTDAQMTAQADEWLRHWLAPMLNHTGRYSSARAEAEVNHTAFFVTWDEGLSTNTTGYAVRGVTGGDNYLWCGHNGAKGDAVCGGQIYTVVVSQYSLHRTLVAHDAPYGLCRTVEWLDHLSPLGNPGQMDNQTGFPVMKALFNFTANG